MDLTECKILFKDDDYLYVVYKDQIVKDKIKSVSSEVLHLDDINPLYHYCVYNSIIPVYYEHDDRIVMYSEKVKYYDWIYTEADWEKDYTLVNLKLL